MRLIRLKLNQAVSVRLGFINRELKVHDEHLVEDIFALIRLKGSGLPSAQRQEFLIAELAKHTKSQLAASIFVKKRALMLKDLVKLPYFASLTQLTDSVYATDKLITQFKKLGQKVRESQCMSCQFHKDCEFGKQYGSKVTNITKVIDPDFSKKTHPDCPNLPDMEFANTMNDATKLMASLYDPANQQQTEALINQLAKDVRNQKPYDPQMDPQAMSKAASSPSSGDIEADPKVGHTEDDFIPTTVSSSTRGTAYDAQFSADYYVKQHDQLIESLLQVGVEIFNIGRVLDSFLAQGDSKLLTDTKETSESRRSDLMREASDITKADKLQHALPNEVFDAKVAKKQLSVEREQKPQGKKHLLYLLIDASGSMRTQFLSNPNSIMSRASLSSVLTIALMKKIAKEKGIVYIRYFTGSVSPLIEVRTPDDFTTAIKKIGNCNFDGGSTNIQTALKAASGDIAAATNEIRRSEILLITDCDDRLSLAKQDLSGAKLSVLDVSGTTNTVADNLRYGTAAASTVLKSIADAYYKADEKHLDLKSIVKLV